MEPHDGFICHAGSGGGSKVKAHVLALICPFTACCGSLWVAIGALVASAPGVRAEEGRALHATDDTARHLRYTSRAKREADVSLSHRCTMQHHDGFICRALGPVEDQS